MADSAKKTVLEELLEMTAEPTEVLTFVGDEAVNKDKRKKGDALMNLFEKWRKLKGEIKKAEKYDAVFKDHTGKVIREEYTAKAWDALKVLKDKQEKFEKAANKAIAEDKWDDVFSLGAAGGEGNAENKS